MKRLNQSGAVSLLSVVVFSLIITVIVTVYLRVGLDLQQEANNYDFSTRAYYAAESGVQDAVRGLNANPLLLTTGQDTCKTSGGSYVGGTGDLGNGMGYTCQLIDTKVDEITGSTANGPVTVRIRPEAPVSTDQYALSINWSKRYDPSDGANVGYIPLVPRDDAPSRLFPPEANWRADDPDLGNAAVHPVMRTTLLSVPTTNITSSNILQKVYFLNPTTENSGAVAPSSLLDAQDFSAQAAESIVQNVKCYRNDTEDVYIPGLDFNGYSCKRSLFFSGSLYNSNDLYVRLSSIYGATDFSITLHKYTQASDTLGDMQKLIGSQATIDVTGKAGDTFRRVKQTVPIGTGYSVDMFPEAALVAGDGICKYFSIGASAAQFSSGCNPTNPPYYGP